jgi:hypothetical protein
MLATYVAGHIPNSKLLVNEIHPDLNNSLEVNQIGKFQLPNNPGSVWVLPKSVQQTSLTTSIKHMTVD